MSQSSVNPALTVSFQRAAGRAALLLLACYLVIAGGKFAGLVLYPLYALNVWLVALGGLAWMAWRWLRRRPFPATPLDLPLLAWVVALLVSALASEDPRVSLERWVFELVCVLVFYLMVDLERAGKRVETWIWLTLLAGTWLLYFGLQELASWYLRWFAIGGWADPIPPATIRVQATTGHANALAAYLNLLWPLAAARLLAVKARFGKALLGLYIAIALLLLYFTSSRGGWLGGAAALAALGFLLALDRREQVRQGWHWLLARKWALGGLVAAALVAGGLGGALLLRQAQHPSHPQGDPRGYIWRVAFDMFRLDPWSGTGPGTYVAHFLEAYSIPPGMLLPHAHNTLINTLGESGLLGLAAMLSLGVAIVLMAARSWRAGTPGNRVLLGGTLAALVGLAMHSQFEVPQVVPLVNLLTGALLAQMAGQAQPPDRKPALPVGNILLAGGWLGAACLGLYSWWGYAAFQRGLDASGRQDWPSAVAWMDEAARRDPALAHYALQAGQAHAEISLDAQGMMRDPAELAKAIEWLERGLARQGSFALDWARLGALRQAGGDLPGAVDAYTRAAELAPESVEVLLALGQALEQNGQAKQAREVYGRVLAMQPDAAHDAFWGETEVRSEVVASRPPIAIDPDDPWAALEAGDFARAEDLFRAQLTVNDAQGYLGLSLALTGQGEQEEGEKALRVAEFVGGGDEKIRRLLCTFMPIDQIQGKGKKCEERYNIWNSSNWLKTTILGNAGDYFSLLFHRISFP